jgi:transcriptional regulator with XRE-family HTH domain
MANTTYAKEIKAIRERLGFTQAEMAARLGVRSDSLSRYERGTRAVPEPTMRLARRFTLGKTTERA